MPGAQLGLVGNFPADYEDNAQRQSLQLRGAFFPDMNDFGAALIQGKHIKKDIATTPSVLSPLTFMNRYSSAGISRIDLITHAGEGQVGLNGNVYVVKIPGGYYSRVEFEEDTSGDPMRTLQAEPKAFWMELTLLSGMTTVRSNTCRSVVRSMADSRTYLLPSRPSSG